MSLVIITFFCKQFLNELWLRWVEMARICMLNEMSMLTLIGYSRILNSLAESRTSFLTRMIQWSKHNASPNFC